jgi:hypothetical protein
VIWDRAARPGQIIESCAIIARRPRHRTCRVRLEGEQEWREVRDVPAIADLLPPLDGAPQHRSEPESPESEERTWLHRDRDPIVGTVDLLGDLAKLFDR